MICISYMVSKYARPITVSNQLQNNCYIVTVSNQLQNKGFSKALDSHTNGAC